MMNDSLNRTVLDDTMREEMKRYVTNQGTIIKSWVMEWTEKGQQYIREDMELLKVEVQNIRKQVILSHREDWSTGLERGWVIREESTSERRKMADRENERVRELDNDRARMVMRVEDLERLVRELERRQREKHTECHLETMFFQQRQKLERLEQRLETRAMKSKEEYNAYMIEACEKMVYGEGQNHEKHPATKPPVVKKGESAEMEAQMMEKDQIIKEMELRMREKDQMLKEMELRMQEKDQILKEMELRMQEKERLSKKEKDMIRLEMVEYKHMMMEKMEILDQRMKDAHAAQIMEMEKQLATRSLMKSRQSLTSSGTGGNCSKRKNGKNRKMAERGRAENRSPAESNDERAKIRRQQSDTSADSDVSSIGSSKLRSSSENSVVALAARELLDDNRLQTHTSLDKTSVCSTASLPGTNLESDAGKGKKGKSWKRVFGGLFKKKTK